MYEARRGNLWFFPSAAVDAACDMGMEAVLSYTHDADCAYASKLLNFIDQLRWSQVHPSNRVLPEVKDLYTPVRAGGVRVEFNHVI